MIVRPPQDDEVAPLAHLWRQGWRDAHAGLVPEALARTRTLASFEARLRAWLADVRVIGEVGAPLGFALLKDDELNQLYVAAEGRGLALAPALMADAEGRLWARGVQTASLSCAIGNLRAARFYEKSGWIRDGVFTDRLETIEGPFDLDVWRYVKRLGPGAAWSVTPPASRPSTGSRRP